MLNLKNLLQQATIMDKMIKNPDTGRMIKVRSALGYKKSSKVYQAARDLVMKTPTKNKPNYKQIIDGKMKKLEVVMNDGDIDVRRRRYAWQRHNILSSINTKDTEKHVKKIVNSFQFKSESQVKELFGDGEILGAFCRTDQYMNDDDEIDNRTSDQEIITDIVTQDADVSRIFNKTQKTIYMSYFNISPDAPKGTGAKIFTNQIEQFKKMGYKKITTYAAGNINDSDFNGYYTWARLGYQFENNKQTQRFIAGLKASHDPELESINSLAQLMSFEKGRKYWRKYGFGFNGVFDLNDNSLSMITLRQYNKDKKEGKK